MIIQAVVKLVRKQFKLDKVLKYVEEPNENNIAIDKIKDELIFMKNKIKQMDSKANRKKDKKWYDD